MYLSSHRKITGFPEVCSWWLLLLAASFTPDMVSYHVMKWQSSGPVTIDFRSAPGSFVNSTAPTSPLITALFCSWAWSMARSEKSLLDLRTAKFTLWNSWMFLGVLVLKGHHVWGVPLNNRFIEDKKFSFFSVWGLNTIWLEKNIIVQLEVKESCNLFNLIAFGTSVCRTRRQDFCLNLNNWRSKLKIVKITY